MQREQTSGMPEISIIIPVYNVEPYLRQCLDSVLAQSFSDFELILIDDGSTDSCGAICDEYASRDGRVHVIHQRNAGQGKARNVGMDRAVGKYLIFLDSDDYWLSATLEALYAEAERNQTQVLVFGAKPFWEGMEEPEKHSKYEHTVQNGAVRSGPESLKTALDVREYYTSPCLRFYLLRHIQESGLRFDEMALHEDQVFSFLAYLLARRVECIGERFYQRRYRPNSSMTGKTIQSSAHGYCVALNGLLDAYEHRALSPLAKEQLERYIIKIFRTVLRLYREAFDQQQNAWRTAGWVQKDARRPLKRARTLPNLPCDLRLATYSLFLGWFVPKAKGKLKRLTLTVRKTLFKSCKGV